LAVREIDGASHNSVDNVRDLIDSFRTLPPPGSQYKIYIIDEVHMLSTSAFNALLKSIEEPPPHTVFILATTEVHKIPETVLSRCQRHELRALPLPVVEEELAKIAASEGVECESGALRLVARLSEGSMRDAQSLLDRVISYVEGVLSEEETSSVLGVVGKQGLFRLSGAIIGRDPAGALTLLEDSFSQGVEPAVLLRDFARHWRDLLLVRFGAQGAVEAFAAEEVAEAQRQLSNLSGLDIQELVDLARSGADDALRSVHPRYALEALVVRMATREPTHDLLRLVGGAVASLAGSHGREGGARAVAEQRGSGADRTRASSRLPAEGDQASSSLPRAIVSSSSPASVPSKDTRGSVLSWEEFVATTSASGSRILGEHLRRLAVVAFQPGILEATGAEFTVASLSRGAGLERLEQALQSYSGTSSWRITLKRGEKSAEGAHEAPSSIAANEKAKRSQARHAKEEAVRQDPGVAALLDAFPGSTIDRVEVSGKEGA
jgi:DNA polymerase III subunit gamma/tau